MYRYSPITFRLFMMLLLLISSIFVSIYWLTVPMIKQNVFGLELNSNRQVLNIVYDLANRMHFSTESYVEQASGCGGAKTQSSGGSGGELYPRGAYRCRPKAPWR